jgi:hypothetical protein
MPYGIRAKDPGTQQGSAHPGTIIVFIRSADW